MANTVNRTRLYSPSAIGSILRIARERACQEERRTKRYMIEHLGITVDRLNRIEAGTAQVPFDLAVEWCNLVGDKTALKQILHIYGMDLPPTDPRILTSVPEQLINFIRQATDAIEAANKLLHFSTRLRPGDSITDDYQLEMLKQAEEILDIKQSAECVITSMEEKWGLDTDTLNRNWIQEAIVDRVIIESVTKYETIRKEQFFNERAKSLGRY